MPSLLMRVAKLVVRGMRRPLRNAARYRRMHEGREYPLPAPIPRWLRTRCDIQRDTVLGSTVYRLRPRRGGSGLELIYVHGGAYVAPLSRFHWRIIRELIRETGANVTVPLYPLAPEHGYQQAYALLYAVYREVLASAPASRVVLAGDSAGGGLALGMTMDMRGRALPLPAMLVLFSPWLDVTMSNPEAAAIAPRDLVLGLEGLRLAGSWWARGDDPRSPRVSPLFGELGGLPPIVVFQGTDDVFLPDVRLLRDRVLAAGGDLTLHETPGAFHVFVAATVTPEARTAFRRVGEHLRALITTA